MRNVEGKDRKKGGFVSFASIIELSSYSNAFNQFTSFSPSPWGEPAFRQAGGPGGEVI